MLIGPILDDVCHNSLVQIGRILVDRIKVSLQIKLTLPACDELSFNVSSADALTALKPDSLIEYFTPPAPVVLSPRSILLSTFCVVAVSRGGHGAAPDGSGG